MKLSIGYVTNDEKTVVKNYSVTNYFDDVKVKDTTDVINPTFILTTPLVINPNYCYCEDWGKYYYVDSVNVMTGGRVAISCRVDVLMTYAYSIKSLSAIIDKQQDKRNANLYIDDGSLVSENRTVVDTIAFDNGFSANGNYILVVAGG